MSNEISRSLIKSMEEVNGRVLEVAEACSEDQWNMPVSDEDARSVGVVCRHIAISYPAVIDWAEKVASGESLPPLTRDQLNELNASHAREFAALPQADTLAYLRQVTKEAAAKLGNLSDDDLNRTAPVPLAGGREFSGKWLVEMFAIGHAANHLEAIEATLAEGAA